MLKICFYRKIKTKIFIFFIVLIVILYIIIFGDTFEVKYRNIKNILNDNHNPNVYEPLKVLELKSKCPCKKNEIINVVKYDSFYLVESYYPERSTSHSLFKLSLEEYETFNTTCDLYNVLRRGKDQRVIGFSLYGQNKKYYKYLLDMTRIIKDLYHGWIMRVYYDKSVNSSIICEVECSRDENMELIDNSDFCDAENIQFRLNTDKMVDASYMHNMKWRWLPIGDNFVSVFSSRDTDSLIIKREIDSVNEWLASNKTGHIMRDNPQHTTTILGGMWGFYNSRDRELANKLFALITNRALSKRYNKNNKSPKRYDQFFLTRHVYPLIKSRSLVHDSYHCKKYGGTPFPSQRIGRCFIGGGPKNCEKLTKPFYTCPKDCRPPEHQEWTYC